MSFLEQSAVNAQKHNHDLDGYSSLIGIITAITGNVLISIALNTQRYAHTRLNEQWLERRRLLKRAERRRLNRSGGSDTTLAKERQRLGRSSTGTSYRGNGVSSGAYSNGSNEREPLLASFRSELESNEEDQESDSETKPPEPSQKSYLRSPYWWAGIILMIIGEAGNFLAYGFAPASIVSPLGVVAIISNCIIAPFFMKEPFRWRDFWGVVIAVAGAVTVVLSASESNPKLGPHEIWALIGTWEFETYLVVTVVLIICLMLASNKYGQRSIFIDLGLVGLFGGYTALSTKGVASLLSYTLFQALTFPVTYLLVIILVFTAVMQIKYVNRALQRFDATQVIPTQFVLFTLCVIIGSAILYRDFETTPGEDAGKFIGGCALTFIGVWLITSARQSPSDDDSEFDDEDEDAIALRVGEQYQEEGHVNGSRASIRHSIAESEEDLADEQRASSMHGNHSKVSLPESLERNHWNSAAESTSTTPGRRSISVVETARSESLLDVSPVEDNPWQSNSQSQFLRGKSSFRRLLEPLTSILPYQSAESSATLEATRSAPDLPSGIESSATTPRTRSSSYHDDDIQAMLGTSLPLHHNHHQHATPPHHRPALTSLYPGPFTSPLSSSLSAVVADSIRRRVRIRSRRSSTRQRPINAADDAGPDGARARGNSEPLLDEHLVQALTSELDNATTPSRSRMRRKDRTAGGPEHLEARGDDDDDDDDEDDVLRSELGSPDPGRKRSLGERLGGIFRSRKSKLASSKRQSDEQGSSAQSPEEQV